MTLFTFNIPVICVSTNDIYYKIIPGNIYYFKRYNIFDNELVVLCTDYYDSFLYTTNKEIYCEKNNIIFV